jgi:hypothetical protein
MGSKLAGYSKELVGSKAGIGMVFNVLTLDAMEPG